MTDIVERLLIEDRADMRQVEREARIVLWSLLRDAAAEIERLRKLSA